MPSLDYFATFDESIAILAECCAAGFQVITETEPTDKPQPEICERVDDELVSRLKNAPGFFFCGGFSRFPAQFLRLEMGACEGKYVIDLAGEGPLLQALVARVNEVDGVQVLLPGSVSYQDAYRNPETGEWTKASAEVKAAYRKLVAVIKKRCPAHPYRANRKLFIGPAALELLVSGKAQLGSL